MICIKHSNLKFRKADVRCGITITLGLEIYKRSAASSIQTFSPLFTRDKFFCLLASQSLSQTVQLTCLDNVNRTVLYSL